MPVLDPSDATSAAASAAAGRPARSGRHLLRDLVTLTKPGVTRMCALTAAGAAWMALRSADNPFGAETPADGWCSPGFAVGFAGVIGASLAVAGASALNMWLERAKDPLMARTRTRPLALPAARRRLSSGTALGFAVGLCLVALAVLWAFTNPLTTVLAAWAIVGYALVYTPLKYRTPLALVIGAVPGAAPPLLGWTAVTGDIDAGGLALFAILLVWQMPHFLAITLFRETDFARAGIRCVPVVRGSLVTRIQSVLWSIVLVPISLLPTVIGLTGYFYGAVALALSLAFLACACTGMRVFPSKADELRWARRFFFASLLYLPALIAAMVVDVLLT